MDPTTESNTIDPLALFHFFSGKNLGIMVLIVVISTVLYGMRVEYHDGFHVDYGKNQVVQGEHILYFDYSGGTLRLYTTEMDMKNESNNVMVYQQWLNGGLRNAIQGDFLPQETVHYGKIAETFFVSKSVLPSLSQIMGRAYFYFLIPAIFFLLAPRLLAFFCAPLMWNKFERNGYKGYENCKYEETFWDKYTVHVGIVFLIIAILLYARYQLYGY